ncbi:MAG: segregation/condensation protein A [Candidatus Woesearchaeota archaeon]
MDKIVQIILDNQNIDWQQVLFEVVKEENMNPWDIDIVLLTKRFIEIIKKLKEMDFNLSGKMILAAVLLLKMKSEYLLDELNENQEIFQEPIVEESYQIEPVPENVKLLPRTPKPRVRKISIYELIESLDEVINKNQRKLMKLSEIKKQEIKLPEKKVDIEQLINVVFKKLFSIFKRKKQVKFSDLLKTRTREEIIYTLLPLLYLSNDQKIELIQKKEFDEIYILMK